VRPDDGEIEAGQEGKIEGVEHRLRPYGIRGGTAMKTSTLLARCLRSIDAS